MRAMRRIVGGLLMIALLGGCAQESQLYKNYLAGVPFEISVRPDGRPGYDKNDLTKCQIEALNKVPSKLITRQNPSYTSPTQTNCSRIGAQLLCNQTGGDTIGGGVTSYDANDSLRDSAVEACMVSLGYKQELIPVCPEHAVFALPTDKKNACYKVDPNGRQYFGAY